MNSFRVSDFGFRAFLLVVVALSLLINGCATGPGHLAVCPGKATAEEAAKTLAARAGAATPLRANGQAMVTYHVPNKKRTERHNLPLGLWFEPPGSIYIQGSIAVDPKAVIVGANDREFWMAVAPKEMSSYYLGSWDEVRDFEGLMMSPRVVLEALGIITEPEGGSDAASWTLENKGPYDILVRRDAAGRMVRRVYVYACDYCVHKIEYFDARGKAVAVAQLGDYQPVAEGFQVPTRIRVVSTAPDGRKDTMDIRLTGVKTTQLNDRQRQFLFSPPDMGKFDNIFRYEAGRWVPE
ncbi:MAG TPA: hypothetical protein PKH24_01780 [Sedimentisphaerales bacterium]|nr:hypothetical protein [Sedimentisphaerales bacterium]HNU28068.1 hypothetical protein [Sedimentisphaerales bacterium]